MPRTNRVGLRGASGPHHLRVAIPGSWCPEWERDSCPSPFRPYSGLTTRHRTYVEPPAEVSSDDGTIIDATSSSIIKEQGDTPAFNLHETITSTGQIVELKSIKTISQG
jgi:hypothetical protein